MHTLYLGIVRYHFRHVIGTFWKDKEDEEAGQFTNAAATEKELQRLRDLLESGEVTQSKLGHFCVDALSKICQERSLQVVSSGKRSLKKPFILTLMGLKDQSLQAGSGQDAGLTTDPGSSEGHGLESEPGYGSGGIEEGPIPVNIIGAGDDASNEPMLATEALKTIQDDIKNTLRPRSQGLPPSNFGSPTHGKLKADQWRTCIEFDLPVSLVKLWVLQPCADRRLRDRRLAVVTATLNLSMAIRWATSTRTSQRHADNYLKYMVAYLKAILELHPDTKLRPIHHNALHIPLFLGLFGPMRGWWMFFFERLIGLLQKNFDQLQIWCVGEMEDTILSTFCAASELRTSVMRPGAPPILLHCAEIV
ncbi:hypothetical protein DFP72DRAFT_761152, partial [Ephemerocybe angulata]